MSGDFWGAAGQVASSLINASSQQGINAENIHMMRENRQWNDKETDEARSWDIEQTDKARAYETNLANTAQQRGVKDLQAAGLNPNLAATGGGASSPGTSAPSAGTPSAPGQPSLVAPQINLPDLMAYGVSMKQLEQTDQKLAIEGANSASGIAKNLTDQELNKAETVLKQKGMFRANMEGKASKVIDKMIDMMLKEPRQTPKMSPEQEQQKQDDLNPEKAIKMYGY